MAPRRFPEHGFVPQKPEKTDLCKGAQKPDDLKDWKKLCFNFSLVFFTPLHKVCNQMLKPVLKSPNQNKQNHKWQKENKPRKLKVVKAINF